MMFGKILVPLDGTTHAAAALPYAEALARRDDPHLVLLRVVPPHRATGRGPDDTGARTADAEAYLAARAEELRGRGLTVDPVVAWGETTRWISQVASSRRIGLIVMAVRHLASWAYGSAARAILDTTAAPILLVPADHPAGVPALDASARLLVPLNGSPAAEAALPIAAQLAAALAGDLLLLRAVPPTAPAATRTAAGYLDHLARSTRTTTLPVDFAVQPGLAPDVIAAAARDSHAALVVMTTHGPAERSEVERLRSGSTTEATFRQGGIPLLLVRSGAAPPASPGHQQGAAGLPIEDAWFAPPRPPVPDIPPA